MNYDGVVNGSDYASIDNAFNHHAPAFAAPAISFADIVIPRTAPLAATTVDGLFSKKKISRSLIFSELQQQSIILP